MTMTRKHGGPQGARQQEPHHWASGWPAADWHNGHLAIGSASVGRCQPIHSPLQACHTQCSRPSHESRCQMPLHCLRIVWIMAPELVTAGWRTYLQACAQLV